MRGVVATDAVIGTFAGLLDGSLIQNRCFLYHLIGNGTGEWRVPVGGMGAVTDALAAAARLGRRPRSSPAPRPLRRGRRQRCLGDLEGGDGERTVECAFVLANVAPAALAGCAAVGCGPGPRASQLKINMLLSRLPRLAVRRRPRPAFAGTFHIDEDYGQLQTAYDEAAAGGLPAVPAVERSTATRSPTRRSSAPTWSPGLPHPDRSSACTSRPGCSR